MEPHQKGVISALHVTGLFGTRVPPHLCHPGSSRRNEMSACRKLRAAVWKWAKKSKRRLWSPAPMAEDMMGNLKMSPKKEGRMRMQGPCVLLALSSASRIKNQISYQFHIFFRPKQFRAGILLYSLSSTLRANASMPLGAVRNRGNT